MVYTRSMYQHARRLAQQYVTPENVGRAVRFLRNARGGSSSTRTGRSRPRSSTGGGVLTVQHDYKRTYTKKRMPRRKRQAWKKFTKKVQAVNLKDRGLITVLYNKRVLDTGPAGGQAIVACHLYGFNGQPDTAEAGNSDLVTIVNNNVMLRGQEYLNNATGTAPNLQLRDYNTKNPTEKIMFESAVLDMTVYNPGTSTLEVDIYTIRYNKFNITDEPEIRGSFTTGDEADIGVVQFGDALANVFPNITLRNRGATPFEMGTVLSRHGIKILGKEKLYISGQQAVNKQFRDSKNRYFDPRGLNQTEGFNSAKSITTYKYKDYTKTYLVVAKNVDPDVALTPSVQVGVTRTYKYTYEGLKQNKNYFAVF